MDADPRYLRARRRLTSSRTRFAVREVLAGRRQRAARHAAVLRAGRWWPRVAYIDPGNFATNIQAGAAYGYTLLWVVLAANLIAMLFQAMSAKIGIVTGRNLAELCRDHFPPAGGAGDVGGQRNRRHGNRPRRIPWRRHRAFAAAAFAAAGRHGGDGNHHLRACCCWSAAGSGRWNW